MMQDSLSESVWHWMSNREHTKSRKEKWSEQKKDFMQKNMVLNRRKLEIQTITQSRPLLLLVIHLVGLCSPSVAHSTYQGNQKACSYQVKAPEHRGGRKRFPLSQRKWADVLDRHTNFCTALPDHSISWTSYEKDLTSLLTLFQW